MAGVEETIVVEKEGEKPEEGGICCAITPWKAALLGPYVDFTGLGVILPLVPFFLQDIETCEPLDQCVLTEAVPLPDATITDPLVNGSCAALPSADISCLYEPPADPMYIGAILSAQYTGVVIGSIFWGRLSDFMGIRRIYLVLLVLDFILFALSAVMTSALGLLIVRGAAGFCAIMPLGTAWVSATAPPEKQMQAFTFLFISIIGGFISGSAIGGIVGTIKTSIFLQNSGWFAAVLTSAGLVLVVFFIIWLGTAPPPKGPQAAQPKPEGVKDATANLEFVACAMVGFLGANEGGLISVVISSLMVSAAPIGYGYSEGAMGGIFVCIASTILLSSLVFAKWLERRTHPQQRCVLLGMATTLCMATMTLVMFSWETGGLWTQGDKVLIGGIIVTFCFQCISGPTSMAIASIIAAEKAKNANGTIMGIQQMFMNAGQAIGPMIGAYLFSINLYAPWLYLFAFEAFVLAMNLYVMRGKQSTGAIDRGVFDLSEFDMSTLMAAPAAAEGGDGGALQETSSAIPTKEEEPYSPPAVRGGAAAIEMEDMKLELAPGAEADAAGGDAAVAAKAAQAARLAKVAAAETVSSP